MYLSATTDKIQVVLSGTVTTNQLQCVASYQDVTSAGMTLPQLSNQALTNNATAVDLVGAAAASTTRQVTHINIYNSDTVAATVTVQKDVSGTDYLLTKALLQVGSTLQWSRESGWNILSNSLQESVIITEFTANGTWTKPQGLKRAMIVCIGAGGGGGSGRCDNAGLNRFGGGGGGGGAVVWHNLAAADLTATAAVTIGTGGTGGTGVSTVATSGNAGTAGGDTSFGTIVIAKGGSGGTGGTLIGGSGGQGGQTSACIPAFSPYSIIGASGGGGATGTGTQGSVGFNSTGAPAGGGGGGINSGNTNATAGGGGGSVYVNSVLISGPASGATPNGVANQSNFLFFSNSLTSGKGLGTGGAGGFPPSTAAGSGGNYGAGGGGGYASLTGTLSGAGGNGGGGLCLIMEIY